MGRLFSSPRSRAILALFLSGMAAVLLRRLPPWGFAMLPACPFRTLTGWRCPGCGSTHALAAMLSGRFADAFHYNAAAVIVWPMLGALAMSEIYSALRWNRWRNFASL